MSTREIVGWTACFSTRLPSIEERVRQGVCTELRLLVGDQAIMVPVTKDSLRVVYVKGQCIGIAIDVNRAGESFRYYWIQSRASVLFPPCAPSVVRIPFTKIGICV